MPQTQISCPRCKSPVTANVEQLFDVTQDPSAKQRLLSGQSNYVRCQVCKYEGRLATPIVYHDNEKELLLTYFPPELAMPLHEQEKLIGPLIKQVMDKLPPEKRKGYLLNPQANLTFESMMETILSKDGITPEALKSQQERAQLIEKLMQITSNDVRSELLKQNANMIDEQFFALFGRIAQNAMQSGQEQIAQALIGLQQQLLEETEYGQKLKQTVEEMEAAAKTLQEAGQSLTREKLLDFVINAQNETRIRAYVSLARNGMDYQFFQLMTERIEKAEGEEKARLEKIREQLLGFAAEVDKQMEARIKQAQDFIESLLKESDIESATRANLQSFTQDAVDIAQQMLQQASQKNDYERMGKLQKMLQILQDASTPPEFALIDQLLQAPDEAALNQMFAANDAMMTDEFLQALSGLMAQMESQGAQNPEAKALGEKLTEVYRAALKYSMKKQMAG